MKLYVANFIRFILLFSWIFPIQVNALTIKEGFDIFRTTGAGKDFFKTPIPGIVFDSGSSDFSSLIVFEGKPLINFMNITLPLPTSTSPENQVDTIIHRKSDAILDGIGSQVTIPIEMVALSLQSVTPIEIRNSLDEIELWDVVVSAPNNPEGSMTIRLESNNGGTYDALVPVDGIFTFTRRNDGAVRVVNAVEVGLPPLIFEVDNAPWLDSQIEPPPNENFLVTNISGLTTNFIPGYSSSKGRVNICGVNLSFSVRGPHVRGPGTGWHGHVATSPTPEPLFLVDPCVPPDLVDLTFFNVTKRLKNYLSNLILIRWNTAIELDNAGFHLWRARSKAN